MNKLLGDGFFLRDARMADIDDIGELGLLLNTINLPANKPDLEEVIAVSERSFSLLEEDPQKRCFLFVLVNKEERIIGTSQIFAKHGSLDSPHMYFQVGVDERYSQTLKKYFRHKTLRFMQNFDGPTEIGSLVLKKEYRSHPLKLGRILSFVRFLFMAMNRNFFGKRVLAELLPPLGENFESVFWEAVGRKFTGLSYYEADIISRKNKEFIKSLFPTVDIYTSLLPHEAEEVIGQVGQGSKGAAHLLSDIGFSYSHRVDPFDGGPHFEADQEDITLLSDSCTGFARLKPEGENLAGLVGHYESSALSGQRFKAVLAPFSYEKESKEIMLSEKYFKALHIQEGALLSAILFKQNN